MIRKAVLTGLCILITSVFLAGPAGAVAEKRVALVIGNNAYPAAPLDNPVNDAADMAQALAETGFTVDKVLNASRVDMLQAVRLFGDRIKDGGVGLFFYAGHGLQVKGENYLVPVDAVMKNEDEVEDYCLKVSSVLRKMETAGNRLNIIILDACRNNPFLSKSRGGGGGLAKMDAPTGSILAYSTAPGAIASDGAGRNGLYTSKLLKYIKAPDLEIGQMFRRVRVEVLAESEKAQVPWESSSLTGEFYFTPGRDQGSAPSGGRVQEVKTAATSPQTQRDLVLDEETGPAKKTIAALDPAVKQPEYPEVKEADRRRVAVLYFDNASKRQELEALKKGLADMMITDLSKIPLLKIVERARLEEVLKEQKLQQTKHFDAATAVNLGKLLGAEIIMVGSYFEMFGQLRLDARMVDVATGRVLKAEGVNGKSDQFFQLKDQLVWSLARNLDARIGKSAKPASKKLPFDLAQDYSRALDLYDMGDLEGARRILVKINQARPDFAPAEKLLAELKS